MQFYSDRVTDQYGNVKASASVSVLLNGLPATIYSDDGVTTQANPITTASDGSFSFYAANGTYTLSVSDAESQTVTLLDYTEAATATPTSSSTVLGETGGVVKRFAYFRYSVDNFPGVLGDGSNDDYLGIETAQSALNVLGGGELIFTPGKTYRIGTALQMVPGITYSGGGRSAVDLTTKPGAKIVSGASDLFKNSASTITGVTFDGLWLESESGGGHIFDWSSAGVVAKVEIKNCILAQNNAAKAVVNATAAGGVFSIWMHHFEYRYEPSNTIPAIYFASTTVNGVTIDTFWSTCRTEVSAGTYSIWVESTNAGGAAFGVNIRQGTFELPGGGSINLLSCYYSGMEQCIVYDLTIVPNNPAFRIAKGTGPASANCWVHGCRSKFGTAAKPDLQIDMSVAGSGNFHVAECGFLWMDGVAATGPGLSMRGDCADNYENLTWLTLGESAGLDLQWRATGASSKDYAIYNGFSGNNDGYLVFTQDGTYVGSIGGSALFQWGGTAASPAFYVTASGQMFSKQKISPGTPAGADQSACGIYAGSGAPSNTDGSDGDFYHRSDGGAMTAIYQKRAGAWVGIV